MKDQQKRVSHTTNSINSTIKKKPSGLEVTTSAVQHPSKNLLVPAGSVSNRANSIKTTEISNNNKVRKPS